MSIIVGVTKEDGLTVSINHRNTGSPTDELLPKFYMLCGMIEAAIYKAVEKAVKENKEFPGATVIWEGEKIKVTP